MAFCPHIVSRPRGHRTFMGGIGGVKPAGA
jgi:hypothetical protein